ncbi:site-specific DNA-methyltransferase [Psychrobacter sp. AOP31-E1-50]|uniref:site-specific DNA-methyltransferase n=1 Tax=Psychrobacter sp. AOP31-E1-50 TaxID=3457692 RepID=UPI0040375691
MTNSVQADKNNSDTLSMHSPNLVDDNVQKIMTLFPNCITESKDENGKLKKAVDFDLLRQELSQSLVEGGQERYRLDWPGKRQAILEANSPIAKTLRPARDESVNFDTTENLFIEGDNLEALKLLQESYLGQVKMIYIDPPYNTGNDFIYEDDFSEDTAQFLERSEQLDEEGNRLVTNTESNGRFHSDWLTMMYSRLKLARTLLRDDGVIFISIDENEVFNLRKICNETFGNANFLTELVIKVRHENRILKADKDFHEVCEYCLVYKKGHSYTQSKKIEDNSSIDKYIYSVEITGEAEEVLLLDGKEVEVYSDTSYNLVKHKTPSDDFFQSINIRGTLKEGNSSGRFYMKHLDRISNKYSYLYKVPNIGNDKYPYRYFIKPKSDKFSNGSYLQGVPLDKQDVKEVPYPNFYDFVKEFNNVGYEGHVEFKNGKKPIDFLNQLFKLAGIENDKNAIVLDFFGGSASTAEACIRNNLEYGGNCKFIIVQINEDLDTSLDITTGAAKATISKTIEFLDSINKTHFLTEVGKERIRRAGQNIVEDNQDKEGIEDLDIGFRVLKIDSTNMKEVYYTPDEYAQAELDNLESHIKEDRTGEDLLFQVMLDWGVPLSLPIEVKELQGSSVYYVGIDSLVACFDTLNTDLIDEISKDKPLKFVSSELAITHDQDKTNIKARFAQLSPDTQVKFI